jgi:hypothetical protein
VDVGRIGVAPGVSRQFAVPGNFHCISKGFEVAGPKEIKTWILGFGSLAKVLEPASLVKEIKDDLGKSLRSDGAAIH